MDDSLRTYTEDPWPTLEDAKREAAIVAEHARAFFGDTLKSVWMYGSRARGDNRPDSDLDLLLVRDLPEPPDENRWDFPFMEELEEKMEGYSILFTRISTHSAEPHRFKTWDTMFFRSIREDGIRIL